MSPLDRCDDNTIAVFNTAVVEARRLGHGYVGTEHLLVALVRHREVLPAAVAALLPGDVKGLSAALEDLLGGPAPRDAELLKTLGIDLDAVRAAVRRDLWARRHRAARPATGSSAVAAMAATQPPLHVAARRRDGCRPCVKQAFEYARQDAERRQRTTIDPAGLLLGMVEVEDAVSNRLLQRVGVDPSAVRRALLDAAG